MKKMIRKVQDGEGVFTKRRQKEVWAAVKL